MKNFYFTAKILLLSLAFFSLQAEAQCDEPAGPFVNWSYCDKSYAELFNVDLSGANLSNVNLSGAFLMDVNLEGANLQYANLGMIRSGGIVGTPAALPSGWVLVNGYLIGSGVELFNADLSGANLSNVNLSGAFLMDVNLEGANLEGANLQYAYLGMIRSGGITGTPAALPSGWVLVNGYLIGSGVDLEGAYLINANLSGVDLNHVNLRGANLSGANLSGANLNEAQLDNADLSGANLIGANLLHAYLGYANLTGVVSGSITGTPHVLPSGWVLINGYLIGSGANLFGVVLSGADLSGANLSSAQLYNADLSGANLSSANLQNTYLDGAILTNANLSNANLTNAPLTNANLINANLINANLGNAYLSYANLSGANLSGANLSGAYLGDANLTGVTSGGITGSPSVLPSGWVLNSGYLVGPGPNFCKGATVALIVANTSFKLYTALTGGSPLAATTALATKTYYIAETINNVVSNTRVPVRITVNALPATPSLLVLTNDAAQLPATPATAIKTVGVYVGAEVALKLTATAVGATSYEWTLPEGVTLADGFTTGIVTTELNTMDVKFSPSAASSSLVVSVKSINASGCISAAKTLTLTRAIPVAPATLKMNNGSNLTAITSFAKYMGTGTVLRLTAAASATATSYVWELPEGANRVTSLDDISKIPSNESNLPEIFVTLRDVTNANTFNYSTTATIPVSTNVLRFGVYGKNGTGLSETSNATLANSSPEFSPNSTSTAKLLTLTAVKPAAPATLKMYDLAVSATAAVTDITKYVNTETELKLEAKASALASSYRWELPDGVTVVNNSATDFYDSITGLVYYESKSNVITINFNYQNQVSSLVGVRAVNGIGESVSTNAAPNASRTDKLLTLTASRPTVPGTVTGSLKICATTASSVTYTIAAVAANARDYFIEAPQGCTITVVYFYGPYTSYDNFVGMPAVANASFTVNYPAGFVVTTANPKTITIKSASYVGESANAKVLTLTNVGAVSCPTAPAAPATFVLQDMATATPTTPAPALTDITKYVNTQTELTLTAATSALAGYYRWELSDGVNVTNNSAYNIGGNFYESESNVITVNFYNVPHEPEAFSLVLGVRAVNGIGGSVSTNTGTNALRTDKLLTLTAVLPTVPGTVTGSLKICATTASSVTYTIATVAKNARYYDIEAPLGCTITVVDPIFGSYTSYDNYFGMPAVANASFTVNYPAGFIANTTTDVKTITIRSVNYVGPSSAKVLTLTNVGAVCTPAPGRIAGEATTADKFSVVAYPNPATEGFRVKSSNGKSIGVQVYDMLGRSIEQRQLQSDTQIGSNYAKGIYNVIVSQGTELKTLRVIKE